MAKDLASSDDIYTSINGDKPIKLVINFDACDLKPLVDNIVVYTKPTAIMLHQSYMQFSNSPITTNNPTYPNKPVLKNVTYKLTNDNKLHIIVK